METAPKHIPPTLAEIQEARNQLGERIRRTPAWQWQGDAAAAAFGPDTEVHLKLELFQHGGSFKTRGALINVLNMTEEQRLKGVTAVSAGNHAIAVAFAARLVGTTAKVVMPKTANRFRVARCEALGAEVILADNVHQAFDKVREIEQEEGRAFIHPFEGRATSLGTATLGLEFMEQVPGLEAVIVPIGGGGLCAGIAVAVKQINPGCQVFGVEPEGADTMHRSFASGQPESIEKVDTIADSLGAPHAEPYTFALCRQFVDGLAKITDRQMADTMRLMFEEMKLAVEPAGASAAAALRYPLKERLAGKKVGLIVCGTNLDTAGFQGIMEGYAGGETS